MRKRRCKSRCVMRIKLSSLARSSAAATARSGRCVVASATRSDLPASSITGCGAPVSSARSSVCPENATPDCVMTLFCTGAVTSACAVPATQSSVAAAQHREHVRGVARVERAGRDGRRSASGNTCRLPAACGADGGERRGTRAARRAGRARARATRAGRRRRAPRAAPRTARVASASEMSGPMPAGSPELTTIRGGVLLTLRRLLRPRANRSRGCARASGGCRRTLGRAAGAPTARALPRPWSRGSAERIGRVSLRRWCRASGAPSTSMRCQPKRDLDRLAELVQRQLRPALARTPARYRRARASPGRRLRTPTPYPRTRLRAIGREVVAADDLRANAEHLLLHGGVVEDLVRPQQDVPHAELVDHRALGAAHLVQLARSGIRRCSGWARENSPGFMRTTRSANSVGSCAPLRQPKLPPSSAVCACDVATARRAKSSPASSRSWISSIRCTRRFDVTLRRVGRHADQDVRDVVVERVGRVRIGVDEAQLELARRDGDASDDVALLELLDEQIAAAVVAIRRVVDVLRREHRRQLLERVAEVLRDAR